MSFRAAFCLTEGCLDCPSSGEKIEDQYDDRKDEEQVDPAPECVAADHAEQPQDKEHNGNRPKHLLSPKPARQSLLP